MIDWTKASPFFNMSLDPDISLSTGTEIYGPHTFVVNVNGTIIGLTKYPIRFVSQFRKLRRARRFSEFISIYTNHHHRAVHIACDGGRICRPLIIVENGRSMVTSEHITVFSFLRSFKETDRLCSLVPQERQCLVS